MQTTGPLLVLAGAGSGKTRVLTTKVAYLIEEENINPHHILAITFTNKAAREMKERILNMVGMIGYKIQISTFHSFGLSILKKHYEKLGLSKNFTILDSEDTNVVIKNILKDMNYDENYRAIKGIKHFRNECDISVWLCQIAKNQWKNHVRKTTKNRLMSIDEVIEKMLINNMIDEKLNDKNEIIELYKKIHKLDEKTKEVMYLRLKGELSYKDIGEILNQTEEWARITFYRGKEKLKEEWKNEN